MRQFRAALSGPVALVPTMGMLHQGHMSLIRLATRKATSVIVSLYVNPTQLAPSEEGGSYHSSFLRQDIQMLQREEASLQQQQQQKNKGQGCIKAIFIPTDQEMYPRSTDLTSGLCSLVTVSPSLTDRLEGRNRPAHFIGVATVCLKLFILVMPQVVVFGEKDYQQTVVVRTLVEEFLLDIEVVVAETVRESDGLAISSRNVFLGMRRREVAVVLWRALRAAAQVYHGVERQRKAILAACGEEASKEQERQVQLKKCGRVRFEVLYFGLSDRETLEDVEEVDSAKGALLSGAIQMLPVERDGLLDDVDSSDGSMPIRLIDSLVLQPEEKR